MFGFISRSALPNGPFYQTPDTKARLPRDATRRGQVTEEVLAFCGLFVPFADPDSGPMKFHRQSLLAVLTCCVSHLVSPYENPSTRLQCELLTWYEGHSDVERKILDTYATSCVTDISLLDLDNMFATGKPKNP